MRVSRRFRYRVFVLALMATGTACVPPADVNDPGTGSDDPIGQPIPDGPTTTDPDDTSEPDGQPSTDPDQGDNPTTSSTYRARVRNESAARADVTLRFILDDAVVHLAFVRVLPQTITTVTSPASAENVEVSGIDDSGRALLPTMLTFQATDGTVRVVEYTIQPVPVDGTPDPTEPDPTDPGPVDPDPMDPIPADPTAPTIRMLEPAEDALMVLGSVLKTRWTDEAGAPGALVRILLRPLPGNAGGRSDVGLGPAVGAALDLLNDQLAVVIEGIDPGRYQVVAEIDDGLHQAESIAPGLVEAVLDPGNRAPTLRIISPSSLVERRSGDLLAVEWQDEDSDDNASVSFSLEPANPAEAALGIVTLNAPFAEDPDGPTADRSTLLVSGLPGLYDLVGSIDDGDLAGTYRVASSLRILPTPSNDSPVFAFTAPAAEVTVEVGRALRIGWTDSDANDDAKISLLLDPDESATDLNGNELLLASALSEDADGSGDLIVLGIPEETPIGIYALVGLISDGLTQSVTRSSFLVLVTAPEPSGGGGPDPTQIRRITLLEPQQDQFTRLGAVIPIRLQLTNIPAGSVSRLWISGTNANEESLRVEITPAAFVPETTTSLTIPADPTVIPNKWWPREFTLEAEVVADGVRYRATAPGSVWIRQEVQVRTVRMINYWCIDRNRAVRLDDPFFGLELEWLGGGYVEAPIPGGPPVGTGNIPQETAALRFWLASDGLFSGTADLGHRELFQAQPSPNVLRTTRVHYADLIGISIEDFGLPPSSLHPALSNGAYDLLTVTDTAQWGRIVTESDQAAVEVCFPLPVGP